MKNNLMKLSITTMLALIMITSVATMVYALDTPCAIYGSVTYNGAPASASVTASHGTVTTAGNLYKVDGVPTGTAVTVTATYNDHSASIVVNTPGDGGAVNDQVISITYTEPTSTPTPATPTPVPPTPTPGPTASPDLTAPLADFGATPSSGTAPLTVQFTDVSTGTIAKYAWYFGDDSSSSQQNPSHTYTAVGNYSVTLMIMGPNGATSSKMMIITVTGANATATPTPVPGDGTVTITPTPTPVATPTPTPTPATEQTSFNWWWLLLLLIPLAGLVIYYYGFYKK